MQDLELVPVLINKRADAIELAGHAGGLKDAVELIGEERV